MKKRIFVLGLICVLTLFKLTGCITVIAIGDEDRLTGHVEFDASLVVDELWESRIIPDLESRAIELSYLLIESDGNLTSLGHEYGKFTMGDTGELNFIVTGSGTVIHVEEDRSGFLTIDLDGYDGPTVVNLQIGTVYRGASVRNSQNVITFDDFTNQVEWANISQNIHLVIDETVVAPVNPLTLEGEHIEFLATFTVTGNDLVLMTPVHLSVN